MGNNDWGLRATSQQQAGRGTTGRELRAQHRRPRELTIVVILDNTNLGTSTVWCRHA
jgi:hypothetical protein